MNFELGAVGLQRSTLQEFQDVTTLEAVTDDEGRVLPAGSRGTIIDASSVEGWFHVEFERPFHCVIGLWSKQIQL